MNNRKFQVWFGLLMVAIAGGLMYWILTVETRNAETSESISESKNQTEEAAGIESQEEWVADRSPLPQYTTSEINTILDVLQPHLFHHDPYVEAKLLFEYKPHCRFKSRTKHHCETVMSRFNELEGLVSVFQDLKEIPANSQIGKALKNRRGYDPKQPEVFRHQSKHILKLLINSENPYLLAFEGVVFMFYGVDYGEILPFSQWLNSQDQEYNRMVLMYSLLKIASRYEADDSNGIVAQMVCNSNKSTCGLGFDYAYKKLVMVGMQKDVDILISHLGRFAAKD